MFSKAIKQTAVTATTALVLALGTVTLSTSAHSASTDSKSGKIFNKLKNGQSFNGKIRSTPHSSHRVDFTKRQIPGEVSSPKSR